jgi:hypothetical protein
MRKIFFATAGMVCIAASLYSLPLWKYKKKEKIPAKTADSTSAVAAKAPERTSLQIYTDILDDSAMCFPLKHDNIYSLYTYVIDLRDERIIDKYKPIFDRHHYEFSGYVWQGVLAQIIAKAGKDISTNTFMLAQEDLVCFTITRYPVKKSLPEYICPILSSPKRFASYMASADRNYINNY